MESFVSLGQLEKGLSGFLRARRVLASHEVAVNQDERCPVLDLLVQRTQTFKFVFNEERNHVGQLHIFFFAIGEPGYASAFNQRLTVCGFHMAQHTRCVANESDWLVGSLEAFNQIDRLVRLREIPQRAMTTWVKDRVELLVGNGIELHGRG